MRWERVYQFLVVLLLIFPAAGFCQQQLPRNGQISPHLLAFSKSFREKLIWEHSSESTHNADFFWQDNAPAPVISLNYSFESATNVEISTPQFNASNLPFFCKKEYQFEKTTSIPLRVRLGSLEYVNKLEGKN